MQSKTIFLKLESEDFYLNFIVPHYIWGEWEKFYKTITNKYGENSDKKQFKSYMLDQTLYRDFICYKIGYTCECCINGFTKYIQSSIPKPTLKSKIDNFKAHVNRIKNFYESLYMADEEYMLGEIMNPKFNYDSAKTAMQQKEKI